MSDIVLGTIIGGSIGVIGSIVGSIIYGYFSKTSTKMQIEARLTEQARQFDHENYAQETASLIRVRRQWIDLLRPTLIQYSEYSLKVADTLALLRMDFPQGKPENPEESAEGSEFDKLFQKLKQGFGYWSNITEELRKVEAQISDGQLKKLISNLVGYEITVWLVSITTDKEHITRAESTLTIIEDTLAKAFKQIEELLSGKREE